MIETPGSGRAGSPPGDGAEQAALEAATEKPGESPKAPPEETTPTHPGAGWLAIREEIPAWMWWSLGTVPILLLVGLWWWVTAGATPEERIMSPTILPSPLEVVRSFPSLWFERELTRNVLVSLGRVAAGFAVGVAVAFPLGLFMGSFTKIKATFNPVAVLGAYLPIPALVPLTLSLLGTGEKQKIGFLALAFVIYLLPLIVAAVDDVDAVYLKTAYTLGASKWQTVTKVLLGISWQNIYQALRLGFGIGWSYILLAEMVDIGRGIGGLIIISQRRGPREHIYLALLVIVALAFVTDKLWAALGKRLFPYREGAR